MANEFKDAELGGVVSDSFIQRMEKAMEGTDGVVMSTARFDELKIKEARYDFLMQFVSEGPGFVTLEWCWQKARPSSTFAELVDARIREQKKLQDK